VVRIAAASLRRPRRSAREGGAKVSERIKTYALHALHEDWPCMYRSRLEAAWMAEELSDGYVGVLCAYRCARCGPGTSGGLRTITSAQC
jgi:hypothetical protein